MQYESIVTVSSSCYKTTEIRYSLLSVPQTNNYQNINTTILQTQSWPHAEI